MNVTGSRGQVISLVIAALLLAALTAGGMYAVAATAATSMAAHFAPPEARMHSRIADISNAVNKASLTQRVATLKCRRLKDEKRRLCDGEAMAAESRAMDIARRL